MKSPLGALIDKAPVNYSARGRIPIFGSSQRPMTPPLEAMGSVGTLFSIVNRLTTSFAATNWRLYRSAKSGREEDRVEVGDHLALRVLNKPNPFYTRSLLFESSQQHVELVGEGWWVIDRFTGTAPPAELWPVRPDRIRPVPHPEKFIAGYIYTGPDGEEVPLDLDQVVRVRQPNPTDPFRGMGAVQTIIADLDGERMAAEWSRNFFTNSAQPGGIIEVPDTLEDDDFNRMRDRWNEQHRGVQNAHRVAILELGQWKDRSFSMKDMQFTDLRRANREMIMEAFGIHKHILGRSDDVNRANSVAASDDYAKWLLTPRLDRWKSMLNNDYLPLFGTTGQGLEFDYDNPNPPTVEEEIDLLRSRALVADKLIRAGFDVKAVLEITGLPDMAWTGELREGGGGTRDEELVPEAQ